MLTRIILIIIALISFLYWVPQLIIIVLNILRVRSLENVPVIPRENWPLVSVILPASNEEGTLEKAIRTRLEEDYPNVEYIIVEDRSTDRTPEIADCLAEEDKRVKVIHIKELPEGWLGKLNAMNVGQKAAEGEWLLFSDSDVEAHNGTLKCSISHCLSGSFDHLALIPRFDGKDPLMVSTISTFLRHLLTAGRVFLIEGGNKKIALGVGAFNLVKRSAFDRTPGFEYLKMDIADDVGLGRLLKKYGAKPSILQGGKLVHLSFYHSIGEMMRASERAIYTTLGNLTWYIPFFAGLFLFFLELSPFLLMIFNMKIGIIALLTAVLTCFVCDLWNRRPLYSFIFYPIAAVLMVIANIRGGILGKVRGGVYWRDVFYSDDELRRGRKVTPSGIK
ncbi:glycosyltransferase [bacterium]|nr:glycosyltransferase [bacterium]